ncbi:MAG TPA: hypothetical protein VLI71_05780 [Gammaproteobacteria bacterium]|nr:hypothetical protein [Gammaproteobacteria bacterium]
MPVGIKKTAVLDLGIQGTTGLKQYGGYVVEEFLPRLQGRQGVLTFREMRDNSSTIGAIGFTIESLIRQAEWRVEPAGDTPEAREWAEFVEGCLDDMSHTFEEFVVEALSSLTYGWAYHEIVYKMRRGLDASNPSMRSKYEDGKIGWRKLPIRSQDTLDRWEFEPSDGGLRGMWQMDPYAVGKTSNAFIPIEKALLFRVGAHKGNPEGRSIYRNAVLDYFKLKRIGDIEAVGIERDMTGLLHMQVPIEILQATPGSPEMAIRVELERMLSTLKRDEREFAMTPPELNSDNMPTGYKLALLATGGRRQIDTNEIALRYMNTITMSTLADFLMLGKNDVGSWALASSKTRLFSFALGAVMDSFAAVMNRFAIPRLMNLNGVPGKLHPHLVHGDIESPPLEEIGQYITALATAGMLTPTKPLERKLLEIGKLPVPAVDEEDVPLPGEGSAEEPETPETPEQPEPAPAETAA